MISDERLAQIRSGVEARRRGRGGAPPGKETREETLEELLAEVDRLRDAVSEERRAFELTGLAMRSPLPRGEVAAMLSDARKIVGQQHDATLAKDFLALYQAARSLTAGWQPHEQAPALNAEVEHLGLHVRRLAPLYDDVRMRLNLRELGLDRRDADSFAMGASMSEAHGLGVALEFAARARARGQSPAEALADPYPVNPAHSVRVQGVDGTVTVQCDHTFKGSPNCVHCGMPISELKRRSRLEAEALASADIRRAVAERPAPPDADVVSIVLGPTLRQRVEAITQTNRIGTRLDLVVQTMFILGMLEAEGMDPRAHVGEPKQHVSVDAAFIRFALPHDDDDERLEVLRAVFAWLHAWLGDGDPLQPSAAAALAALPR